MITREVKRGDLIQFAGSAIDAWRRYLTEGGNNGTGKVKAIHGDGSEDKDNFKLG